MTKGFKRLIGLRLRAKRESVGLTRAALAGKCEESISIGFLTEVENGIKRGQKTSFANRIY